MAESLVSPSDGDASGPKNGLDSYNLSRPADVMEKLYKIHAQLGVLANVIACASYTRADNLTLTKPVIFAALTELIKVNPALAVIVANQPSVKNEGFTRSWHARLKTINLQDCVTFVDYPNEDELTAKMVENEHNSWFDADDKTKPLWRVVVVNGRHVMFVFHHTICDGRSGMLFHQGFLAALNSSSAAGDSNKDVSTTSALVEVSKSQLKPESVHIFSALGMKMGIWNPLVDFIQASFVRLFLRHRYSFFTDAQFEQSLPTLNSPVPVDHRPITKIGRLRISSSDMAACLVACRKYGSSFTTLLHTLIQITLATDLYPKSILGCSYYAIDLRYCLPDEYKNVMANYVSSVQCRQWLWKYRKAGGLSLTDSEDISPIWKLAQNSKEDINSALFNHTTPLPVQSALGLTFLGEDDEEFAAKVYSIHDMAVQKNFCVSSLGSIDASSMPPGVWSINGFEFSPAAQKAAVGPTLYIATAGVKGGICTINVVHGKGVMEEERIGALLKGVERRLKSLLEYETKQT